MSDKYMMRIIIGVICLLMLSVAAFARIPRSHAALVAFARVNPCPSTGLRITSCPGYVIDHRIGLCVGGPDIPENMRWMTIVTAKAKDRWECKPGWKKNLRACEAKGCFSE